jgi:hypothetical protein
MDIANNNAENDDDGGMGWAIFREGSEMIQKNRAKQMNFPVLCVFSPPPATSRGPRWTLVEVDSRPPMDVCSPFHPSWVFSALIKPPLLFGRRAVFPASSSNFSLALFSSAIMFNGIGFFSFFREFHFLRPNESRSDGKEPNGQQKSALEPLWSMQ